MAKKSADAVISYGESDKTLGKRVMDCLESLVYTDVASGQSDSISLSLANLDKEWMGNKMPKRGTDIAIKIVPKDWGDEAKPFTCGTFMIDDISFSGRPLACNLGGVSTPVNQDFKSEPVTKTWEKATLKDIASKIGKNAGVNVYYEGDAIQIKEIEQNNETDSSFLYSLCDKYGMAMKVYNKKIVIFDPVKYEAKDPVRTLREKDMTKWSYNTTVEGTYTGVSLKWTDPDKDKIDVTMGKPGRMYSMNTQATSKYDAELQAAAKVNEANRKIETMDVTVPGEFRITASQCVLIKGLGNANGKYYIDSVKHSVSGSGYTMQLSMHKVQTAIKVNETAEEKKAEQKKQSGGTNTKKEEPKTYSGCAQTYRENLRKPSKNLYFMDGS